MVLRSVVIMAMRYLAIGRRKLKAEAPAARAAHSPGSLRRRSASRIWSFAEDRTGFTVRSSAKLQIREALLRRKEPGECAARAAGASAFSFRRPIARYRIAMITTDRKTIRVAFQGEPGAFSEAAAIQLLGESITTVPRAT